MRASTIFCALAIVCIISTSVWAIPVYPAPWRGEPGSTYQKWGFGDDTNPALPDEFDNDYGTPTATVSLPNPWTVFWIPEHHGHQGVWKVTEYLQLDIPNTEEGLWKDILLEMIYADGTSTDDPWIRYQVPGGPIMTADPPIQTEVLPDGVYEKSVWYIYLEPNPPSEIIVAMPSFCELYIDEISVDTLCTPEPGTIALFGLGALTLLRKRRRA